MEVEIVMVQTKPPSKLKVGYRDYTVQVVDTFGSSGQFGECNHATGVIQYKPVSNSIENVNTILHETLHACVYVFGMHKNLDHDAEEYVVNTLTNALIGVFKDNPKLLTYIKDNL